MKYDKVLNKKNYIQNVWEVLDQIRGLRKVIPEDASVAILYNVVFHKVMII